jgi:hypothetical protein
MSGKYTLKSKPITGSNCRKKIPAVIIISHLTAFDTDPIE